MNFGDENGIAFYSFYFYTLQLYCVLSHYRSVAFVYSGADRENLTALRRPGGSKNRNPRNPRNPPKFTKSSVY